MQVPNSRAGRPAGASTTRLDILHSLRSSEEPVTVQQLVDDLGLHPNTVRFHLTRLVLARLVREDQAGPTGPGRPRLVYTAVTAGGHKPASDSGYQLLAEVLANHLASTAVSPAEEAFAAGQEWARQAVHLDDHAGHTSIEDGKHEVFALMQKYGFEPEWDPDGQRLMLRACPFRTVADQNSAVACSVHLGLMQGSLEALNAPVTVTSLQPLPGSPPCLAVFTPRVPEDSPSTPSGEPGE